MIKSWPRRTVYLHTYWKQTNRDLAIFFCIRIVKTRPIMASLQKKYFAKCQMRMDLFSILCASNSEDERVEKSNNWIFLQIPSNSGACECNVSIVVFCSRIKRARCYHVLWKWTPYRVTYSSWGQVLTDARSNRTDFLKQFFLTKFQRGYFFLDVVGLMDNNDFVCAICHEIEAILETETAGNWFYGFSTQCVPIPAFFFICHDNKKQTHDRRMPLEDSR